MVKTINQVYQEKYQADKNRKIFFKIFLFLVVFLSLSGGAVYLLFFSNFFDIREISIFSEGQSAWSGKNPAIRSLIDDYLSETKLFIPRFSNIFMADARQIGALVGEQFPAAENIQVKKRYFHALEIYLEQKTAAGIWCYKKDAQCFYFDRQGTAFNSVSEASGTLLLNIDDERGRFEKLGRPVAGEDLLNLIILADVQLKKIKMEVLKFITPTREDFRLEVQTVEGWKIYLNTEDDLIKQISNLEIFMAQKITPEKRSQLQYIDLTVPNRVYYK